MLMKDLQKDWTIDHEENVKELGLFDSVLENIEWISWNHARNEKICLQYAIYFNDK